MATGATSLCDHEVTLGTLKKSGDGNWEIRQTTLDAELRKKPYLRWVREVKGRDYQELRRTEAELLTIYENGGRDALLTLYSKAHAARSCRREWALDNRSLINDEPKVNPRM